jgi:hypothetical protein
MPYWTVADPDRKFSGGNLDEWGHFLYKFGLLNFFCLKYEWITLKFKILSGGHCPHSAILGSAHDIGSYRNPEHKNV